MHTHSVGEDENNRSGQRNAWETGELGLYNVCMPVQEPEHKAPMSCHPVQRTFFVAASPTLPVLELLQDGGVVLLWCLAISYSCCWCVTFRNLKDNSPVFVKACLALPLTWFLR